MEAMLVLTAKRDGGTQDVLGFYKPEELEIALDVAKAYLSNSLEMKTRRAIICLELYNPIGRETF